MKPYIERDYSRIEGADKHKVIALLSDRERQESRPEYSLRVFADSLAKSHRVLSLCGSFCFRTDDCILGIIFSKSVHKRFVDLDFKSVAVFMSVPPSYATAANRG
jgi:hypothetical protein